MGVQRQKSTSSKVLASSFFPSIKSEFTRTYQLPNVSVDATCKWSFLRNTYSTFIVVVFPFLFFFNEVKNHLLQLETHNMEKGLAYGNWVLSCWILAQKKAGWEIEDKQGKIKIRINHKKKIQKLGRPANFTNVFNFANMILFSA